MPWLLRGEAKDVSAYAADPEARDLAVEERRHARVLRELSGGGDGLALIKEGGQFLVAGGGLRAAVLGVNDGLVSNFSLVMGVAGGTGTPEFVLLAGVAGLLAGAFSMAAGEYVSMRSQRDLYEHRIDMERAELEEWPEEEEEELVLIYQAKGFSQDEAAGIAKQIMSRPQVALEHDGQGGAGLALGSRHKLVRCLCRRGYRTGPALHIRRRRPRLHPQRRSERGGPGVSRGNLGRRIGQKHRLGRRQNAAPWWRRGGRDVWHRPTRRAIHRWLMGIAMELAGRRPSRSPPPKERFHSSGCPVERTWTIPRASSRI